MAVNLEKRRPVFHNVFAGLSGPAIKPLALKLVSDVTSRVHIPVIGMGGITTGRDVLEFILVGAAAVQTGTINMIEPLASVRIIQEMKQIMRQLKIESLSEIRGKIRT